MTLSRIAAEDPVNRDVSVPRPEAQLFHLSHDEVDGWFVDVPQNMNGATLDAVFNMIENKWGLIEIDPDDNDAIVLDNGMLRIWLTPMSDDDFEYDDGDAI